MQCHQDGECPDGVCFSANAEVRLDFAYADGGEVQRGLYDKGVSNQWRMDSLDWSLELDPSNPLLFDDVFLPVYGTDLWEKASDSERSLLRHHYQAHTVSQFLHGEQAALIAAGRLTQSLPFVMGKRFAAQQAADEARHIEVFERLVKEKIGTAYEMDPAVLAFLQCGLSDARWDFGVLTSQVLIEGLALGLLQRMRDFSRSPLIRRAAAYIMADEARHVAFGLDELSAFYAQLTDHELRERAEFARDGLHTLKQSLNPSVVLVRLGLVPGGQGEHAASRQFAGGINRLTARLNVMLQRLRLEPASGGVDPQERLRIWERADVGVLARMP